MIKTKMMGGLEAAIFSTLSATTNIAHPGWHPGQMAEPSFQAFLEGQNSPEGRGTTEKALLLVLGSQKSLADGMQSRLLPQKRVGQISRNGVRWLLRIELSLIAGLVAMCLELQYSWSFHLKHYSFARHRSNLFSYWQEV